ncbi:MAG: hypothetical protein V2A65_04520 [Candidatus Omnitrophota bacterium]
MKKGLRKGMVLVFAGIIGLAFLTPGFSQTMTAEQISAKIKECWGNAKDFQADMALNMEMMGTTMKMEGTVWQKEKLFRMEMTMPAGSMGAPTTEPMKMLMVFDGKTMWQLMPMMNMVTKIDFASLEGKIKEGMMGSMSKPLYSLPEVSYQISEKEKDGKGYYFLETTDIANFVQKSSMSGAGVNLPANMPFQGIGIWVNKTSSFPELTEFYSQEGKTVMSVEMKNVKTNQNLSPELFTFKVPEGVQVMDMTEMMKKMAGKIAPAPQPEK